MIGWFSPNAILESTDSQLEGLPVDNITTRRLHSGFFGRYRLKIAVWVYAKPLGRGVTIAIIYQLKG